MIIESGIDYNSWDLLPSIKYRLLKGEWVNRRPADIRMMSFRFLCFGVSMGWVKKAKVIRK